MKTRYLVLGLALLGIYAPTTYAGEWLIGVKAGMVNFDLPGSTPALNSSVMIGKEIWDIGVADIGFEGELTQSVTDGEIGNSDAKFKSMGGYAFLRTAGPVYAIAKIGMTNAEINDVDDSNSSSSLGLGVSTGGLRWEIEYTQYRVENLDIDMISLGLSF